MVDIVDVGPTEDHPTHHLSLTDGVTTLGLILCDRSGSPSNLPLRETPIPATVTRVASQDSGYSDLEAPYVAMVQEDWASGRGQEDFENDKTRFADSLAVNTSRGDIICAAYPWRAALEASSHALFFEYFGSTWIVLSPMSGGAPKIYLFGLRGMAKANTGDLGKLHTARSLIGQVLTNCYVQIVEGPGYTEEQNWRRVTAWTETGTDDTVTVSPAWNIEHTTATRYVIFGIQPPSLVTGHGLTKTCTDVLVADDFVYFCQGAEAAIQRGHLKSDDTWEWGNEGSSMAHQMEMIADKTGKRQIWAVTGPSEVKVADAVTWGTALTFGTAIVCGNTRTRITNLIPYSDPQKPYVMKEDAWGSVYDSIWAQVPLGEMAAVKDTSNGKAAVQNDVYLYFSLRDGLERYYQGKLDDIGPNKDAGLPSGRQGPIAHMLSHPTGLICAIDGGLEGYSSIMHYNKQGWHEWYRAPQGFRIRRLHIQTVPGSFSGAAPDRLWWYEEGSGANGYTGLMAIAANPQQQPMYTFFSGGQVVSSYIYTSMAEIIKYWGSVKLFTEGCSAVTGQTVTVEYRTDAATAWTLAGTINTSPSQKLALGAHNVTGQRFQYRLTLNTTVNTLTPRVKRVLVEGVQRVPPNRVWTVSFYIADEWADLQGGELTTAAKAFTDQLRTWANSQTQAAPLILHHNFDLWDDIYVFVEPASIQPIEPVEVEHGRIIRLVGQMTLRAA